jgi:hypothetical protein
MSGVARFLVGFAGGLGAFLLVAVLPLWPRAGALTPHQSPPWRIEGLHPTEGGVAPYTLCGEGDLALEDLWAYGPNTWETAFQGAPGDPGGVMHFTESLEEDCDRWNPWVEVVSMWEDQVEFCPGGSVSCAIGYGYPYDHGDGRGEHWHVYEAYVVYVHDIYMGLPNDNWRRTASAHEWGHLMGLADIDWLSNCPESHLLMAGTLNPDRDVPCVMEPYPSEVCSSLNAYGFDPDEDCVRDLVEAGLGTDPYNPDTDGDGCVEGQEIGMGFNPLSPWDVMDVPAPAHPDPTPNGGRNRSVDIGDVLAVMFYAFTADDDIPNAHGVDYDSLKDGDWNGPVTMYPDLIEDDLDEVGRRYDRSPGDPPTPQGFDPTGPPNGGVDVGDVLGALAQAFDIDCSAPEGPPDVPDGAAHGPSGDP